MIDRSFARDEIQRRRPVQGDLDPLACWRAVLRCNGQQVTPR
jgi:hypothetical protein